MIIQPTLFVVAGGSGGHIVPALQLADQWSLDRARDRLDQPPKVLFFSGTSDLEKKILKNRSGMWQVIHWSLHKLSLRQWWTIPMIVAQFIALFCKSIFYCAWYRPEKVISTGGLISLPLCFAAWIMRRPVEIYELNVIPGKAVKVLLPFARSVHLVFPQTRSYCRWGFINFSSKCHDAAYPLRFRQEDKHVNKDVIIKHINAVLEQRNLKHLFDASHKTIFVLGGSQGSRLLNNLIKDFLLSSRQGTQMLQVIHQIGGFEERSWEQWYEQQGIPALTFSYNEAIGQYYALADLIVCRAGAGTLFEIAFFDKHCIVIPLVAATTDHQIHNAYAMAQQYPELFTVLEQEVVVGDQRIFFDVVNSLLR